MAESTVSLGGNTISVVQALNQYITGIGGGYLIDYMMSCFPVEDDNIGKRIFRNLMQVSLNGIALHYMLRFIHGDRPVPGYRDPTGGYLLVIGLIQAQPTFMRNGKELVTGFSLFIQDALRKNQEVMVQDNK